MTTRADAARAELYAADLRACYLFLGCLGELPVQDMLDAVNRADVAGGAGGRGGEDAMTDHSDQVAAARRHLDALEGCREPGCPRCQHEAVAACAHALVSLADDVRAVMISQVLLNATAARDSREAAYQQLAYLWGQTGSCPCGARRESPATHPHVGGCPTAEAVRVMVAVPPAG